MNQRDIRRILGAMMASAVLALAASTPCRGENGSLTFDVLPWQVDVTTIKKVKKRNKSIYDAGAVEWGIVDHTLVISQVNRSQLAPPIPYATPYGDQQTIDLEPGDYTITCVAFRVESTASTVEAQLTAGAYFNEHVLSFTVRPDKSTSLEVEPVIKRHTLRGTGGMKFDYADLTVRVIEDGQVVSEATVTEKSRSSIRWSLYSGDLKRQN